MKIPVSNATKKAIARSVHKSEIDDRVNPAIIEAQKQIQGVLLALENEHGLEIDSVTVDTRNFANFRTEIFEKAPRGR